MAEDLKALLARVIEATGPDAELDRLIHFSIVHPWLAEKCVKWAHALGEGVGHFLWWDAARLEQPDKEGYPDYWAPAMSSVDAALDVLQQAGGRLLKIDTSITGRASAMVEMPKRLQPSPIDGEMVMLPDYGYEQAVTIQAAILAALLQALIARDAA